MGLLSGVLGVSQAGFCSRLVEESAGSVRLAWSVSKVLGLHYVGVCSWSCVSRYGARYFAAIFAGGDQVGVSVISELNP